MPTVRITPLEAAWEPLLAASLGRRIDPRALSLMVSRVSALYRGEDVPIAHGDALAARALFWFPRDVHKSALPVHELLAAGALPDRPLRVLDLGAGLGATSLGVARALAGHRTIAHVTAIDRDPQALALLKNIAGAAMKQGLLPRIAELVTEVRDVADPAWDRGLGEYDLVLAGLSLVELTRSLGDEHARAEAVARHVERALAHVAPDGALVVIEPAYRAESRALERARDALVARGVTVFAPCVHTRPCPMLAHEKDWCHEDLEDVALPPWLVPVARAAGLRFEGLTFSYLTLRRDARTLADAVRRPDTVPLRLVSRPLETKGKTEVIVCGDVPGERASLRLMQLDRDVRKAEGPTLGDLVRGDLITVDREVIARAEEARPLRVAPGQWAPATLKVPDPGTSTTG